MTDKDNRKPGFADGVVDWVARGYANHTLKLFFSMVALMWLLTIIAVAAGAMTFSEQGDNTWRPANTKRAKQTDAAETAEAMVDPTANSTSGVRTQINDDFSFFFLYQLESGEGDILTPGPLKHICEIEQLLTNRTEYPSFCLLDAAGDCVPQTSSIVEHFYGTEPNCTLLDSAAVDAIASDLYAAGLTVAGRLEFGLFLGDDTETTSPPQTSRTKSVFKFGGPLAGYDSLTEKSDDQLLKFAEDYCTDLEKDLFDMFGMKSNPFTSHYRTKATHGPIEVRWWGQCFELNEWQRLLYIDMSFAVLSIIFVWVWMRVHTGSCFIATMGMMQIVLSLSVGAFLYGVVGGIAYFHILHILLIFLVLGIGADDIFVYTDSWRQALDEIEPNDPEFRFKRVRYALARTAHAVFNTSFTTAVAFLSQTGSELMPIRSLGIYATIVIIVNYLFAIGFTPTVVLIAEDHFKVCCFGVCGKKRSKDVENGVEMSTKGSSTGPSSPRATIGAAPDSEAKGSSRVDNWLQKFYVQPMLYHIDVGSFQFRPLPWTLVILMLAYAAQAIYFAFSLTPPTEEEKWFPDDHMFTGIHDAARGNYLTQADEQYAVLDIVYGIEGIDRSDYNFWKPGENLGEPIFDDAFEMHTASSQTALFAACETIRTFECGKEGCAINLIAWPNKLDCFIEDFSSWLNTTEGFTLPEEMTESNMTNYLSVFRDENPAYSETIGIIDSQLKFVKFTFLSTLNKAAVFEIMDEVVNKAYDLEAQLQDDAPDALKSVFIEGGFVFTWLQTQQMLIDNLIEGIAICSPVVFILLIIATKNIQVAFFALASVLFIVASVLGFGKWLGWALGIAESISGVIVIGFAVDYTIHLGHMYMEGAHNGHESRGDRFKFAVTTMGGTIVANSITTFGAGVMMFATQLVFFQKMATLITSTIFFSFIFASLFFMGHCAAFGPEKNFATIDCSKCSKDK